MYSYHHHYHIRTVLKKNFQEEYSDLVKKYGKENIELQKELTFAFKYRCWVNDDGWGNKKIKDIIINESENTYSFTFEEEESEPI